jgi:hypothetical protein
VLYLTVAKVVAVDVIGLLSVALPHRSLPSATAPPLLCCSIMFIAKSKQKICIKLKEK